MTQAIAKVLMAIIYRLVTEKFFSKTLVYGLNYVAQSTKNTLDDKMVTAIAESLEVKI